MIELFQKQLKIHLVRTKFIEEYVFRDKMNSKSNKAFI